MNRTWLNVIHPFLNGPFAMIFFSRIIIRNLKIVNFKIRRPPSPIFPYLFSHYTLQILSNICNLWYLNFRNIGYVICGTVTFIFETRELFFRSVHGGAIDFNLLTTWLAIQALTSNGQSATPWVAEVLEKDCRNHSGPCLEIPTAEF